MPKKKKEYNPEAMAREKLRLMEQCKAYEDRLRGHVQTITEHPAEMAMSSILPFEKGMKEGVMTLIQLLSGTILPVVLGATMKRGSDPWTKNVVQIAQALIITWAFKFFKNRIDKKKAAQAAAAESPE